MNTRLLRWSVIVMAAGLLTTALTACVVAGDGYGYGGVDYYAPVGGVYGVWGPGYQVGPYYRDGGYRRGGDIGAHAYRSAPASHSMPSIPSHSRRAR